MRSKSTTYILIVVVLVLWGFIAKKIFFSQPSVKQYSNKETAEKPKAEKEADTLILNYRDPFLSTAPRPVIKSTAVERVIKPLPPQPIVEHRRENPAFRFVGKIVASKQISYIIELNGTQHTISKGDIIDGFKLEATYPDSIHFKKNKYIYSVRLIE